VRRVLVTGGSGFIGTRLVELLKGGDNVVLNVDIAEPRNPEHRQFFRKADILDPEALEGAAREFGATHVVHLAAEVHTWGSNMEFYRANTDGTRHVVRMCAHVQSVERAIFTSTKLVAPEGYRQSHVEDYRPYGLYGESKVISEKVVREDTTMKCAWCVVRPSGTWGPWGHAGYSGLFRAVSKGVYFHPGRISPPKRYGYVGNVGFQLMRLLEAPVDTIHRQTFYIADYEVYSVREWANTVADVLGRKRPRTLPGWFVRMAAKIGDVCYALGWHGVPLRTSRLRHMWTDTTQLDMGPTEEIVGPLPYTLKQGVAETVEWLKAHGQI